MHGVQAVVMSGWFFRGRKCCSDGIGLNGDRIVWN